MKKGHENLIIAISKCLGLSEPLIFLISGGVGIQTQILPIERSG